MNKLTCDVLICGAGVIGLSLALRLAQFGIKIIIIDHSIFIPNENTVIPNFRVSAINYASVEFFKKINVWKNIPSKFYTSYNYLETWEYPSATVTFHSKSIGLSEMGRIVEHDRLRLALWKNIQNTTTITLFCPSTLISLECNDIFWECILDNNFVINSRLLIGADGVNSQIRQKLGIKTTKWKYNQNCMLLMIKTEKNNDGTIWQVLAPNGPIGFLPLYNRWGSLMWFDSPEHIQSLRNLPISVLENKLEKKFYRKLGKITLHNISVIPLVCQCAHNYIALRTVLIGDSAHSIHPLAGQGINLGIRDVEHLSTLLINNGIDDKFSVISEKILQSYQNFRKIDIYTMQFMIHCFYFAFHNNFLPLKIARNIAFIAVERCLFIKKQLLKYALGL